MSCENRKHGNVKKYFSVGYGFLFCEEVPVDIFFHLNNWRSADEPVVGQKVTFELGPAKKKGQPMQAVLIHPVMSAGLEALTKGDPINADVSQFRVSQGGGQ